MTKLYLSTKEIFDRNFVFKFPKNKLLILLEVEIYVFVFKISKHVKLSKSNIYMAILFSNTDLIVYIFLV